MLGEALLGQGSQVDAGPYLREGYEGLERREAKETEPTRKLILQEAYGRIAALCDAAGRREQADDWRIRSEIMAARLQQAVEARHPITLLRLGKTSKAVARVAELTKEAHWNCIQWYDFACVYAVAGSRDADRKQEYAGLAMELLHKAVKAGYDDGTHMAIDPNLISLRDRNDFKGLLAEITKAAPSPR